MSVLANNIMRSSLLLGLVLFGAAEAGAQSTSRLVAEGNQLAREGLYRAALVRYRQAEALGDSSPLLAYNRGVAHYKAGQYEQAEQYLERASQESRLSAVAYYNLGLVKRAQRDREAAARWLRQAGQSSTDARLRRLAKRALDDVRNQERRIRAAERGERQERFRSLRASRDRTEPPGEFEFAAVMRVGTDDNVYRSPSASYVDLSQAGQPTVDPVEQSGTFIPINLNAKYTLHNEAGDTDFIFSYNLDGDFYTDKELDNANRITQRFRIAADMLLGEETPPRRRLYAAFVVSDHIETNVDPDDGLDRVVNGVDVSDRFSYRSAGIDIRFRQKAGRFGRWSYGADGRFQRRDYENPDIALVPNFDHNYVFLRGWGQFLLSTRTALTVGVRRYQRNYDERPARDANGVQALTNPTLKYEYTGYEVGIRHRWRRSLDLRAEYQYVQRDDDFVGYFDYQYDQFRIRATFDPRGRFKSYASVTYRAQDYPNAFNFNVPAGGPRDLDILAATLVGEIRLTKGFSLWAEVGINDYGSSDPRADYSRLRGMLGFKWANALGQRNR